MTNPATTPGSNLASMPADQWKEHRPDIGLLIVETENFIVYLTKKETDVHWETTPAYDVVLAQKKISASDCQSKITYLESLPINHFSEDLKRAFRSQLGEAMVFALRGQPKKSAITLKVARAFYVARSQEYARRTYMIVSAITTVCIAVAAFLIRYFNQSNGWGWVDPAIIYVGVGSSMGALLFSLTRMSKTAIDPDAETKSHIVEAVCRVVVSMIVAVIAVCAVRGGFFLSQVIKDDYGFFLLCVIAGASERFGGAIVEHFDNLFSRAITKNKTSRATARNRRRTSPASTQST